MAIFRNNYQAIKLSAGQTYTTADLGNGITASTVNHLFCISGGTITFTPLGGTSTFTWGATSGQYMDIILGSCSVASGEFAAFKSPSNSNGNQRVFYS